MRKIINCAQRIQTIRENLEDAQKKPGGATKRIMIRGKAENLFVLSLPIDLLMFRLENARTRRQQLRYLKNHPDSSSGYI